MADNSLVSDIIKGVIVVVAIYFIFARPSGAQQPPIQQSNPLHDWQPMNIPRVDDIKSQTSQPLEQPVQEQQIYKNS